MRALRYSETVSNHDGGWFSTEQQFEILLGETEMSERDDWGHDPSVQGMRRVFARMEKAQQELLGRLSISPFDPRLRRRREEARTFFERAWPLAARRGIVVSEEDAASLYAHCLARTLRSDGIEVPSEALPCDERILEFLSEEHP